MTETDIIKKILNINYNDDGTISTLSIGIRNARELSEREIESGKRIVINNIGKLETQLKNNTVESNKFIALANYLIIVDLIGNIFKNKKTTQDKDKFKHTLKQFSSLSDSEINSLKNLRNSLAHKFSLGNESEVFILDYSEHSNSVINPPSEMYPSSKREQNKTDKNITTAYFINICDLVEDIYNKLILLEKSNKLELLPKYKMGNIINVNDINSMYFIQ